MAERTCAICASPVIKKPGPGRAPKYCEAHRPTPKSGSTCGSCGVPVAQDPRSGRWPRWCSAVCKPDWEQPRFDRRCRCGVAFVAANPRATYCSRTCWQKYYRQDHPEQAERDRQRYFPRKAISYATCGYCDQLFVVRRQALPGKSDRCCRRSECRRAYRNDEVKRFQREYRERTGVRYEARYQDKRRANNHVRRLRTRGVDAAERFSPDEIHERDGWCCGICGRKIGRRPWPHPLSATLDHIIPISQGGEHSRANVRTAHLGCNSGRRDRGGNEQLRLIG